MVNPVIVKVIADEINEPDKRTLWEEGVVQLPVNPMKEVQERVETVNDEANEIIMWSGIILEEGVTVIWRLDASP